MESEQESSAVKEDRTVDWWNKVPSADWHFSTLAGPEALSREYFSTMADKLMLDGQVKDLKLGETFNKSYKDGAFHTIRCE